MGREIRRVPPNWEHPRDARGEFRPLLDRDYESAAGEWLAELMAWESGGSRDRAAAEKQGIRYFWDWDGSPPDKDFYRPRWSEAEATAFQVYETVTEGTPVSPVLLTREAVKEWAISKGHSVEAAAVFAEHGWVPSGIMITGRGYFSGIESAALRLGREGSD